MNLQTRLDKYLSRGFQQPDADILVLIEETASALFSAFPGRFILIGGATLVLLYDSPRLSRDIDLLASTDDLPSFREIEKIVADYAQPFAETFGLGRLECVEGPGKDFVKTWVQSGEKKLFTIDLTRIGGSVLESEVVREKIAGDERIVVAPSAHYLLLQKCETFLARRYPKCRDAFDIDILLLKGAQLKDIFKAHLHDFIEMRELDRELIRARIQAVNSKSCTVELRNMLPEQIFAGLVKDNFKKLRDSLETVYSDWL